MMLNASIITVEKLGRRIAAEELTLERALGAEQAAQAREAVARHVAGASASPSPRIGAVAGDGGAAAETSASRLTAMTTRRRSARAADTGTGLTSAPSTSQRPPSRTGAKIPGSA